MPSYWLTLYHINEKDPDETVGFVYEIYTLNPNGEGTKIYTGLVKVGGDTKVIDFKSGLLFKGEGGDPPPDLGFLGRAISSVPLDGKLYIWGGVQGLVVPEPPKPPPEP